MNENLAHNFGNCEHQYSLIEQSAIISDCTIREYWSTKISVSLK